MAHDDTERPEPTGPGVAPCAAGGAPQADGPSRADTPGPGTDGARPADGTRPVDAGRPVEGAHPAGSPDEQAPEDWSELPAPLRARLADIAGTALGGLPPGDVPTPLRRFTRFTPAKRARLGGHVLVARLQQDPAFRATVVAWWSENRPGELELPEAPSARPATGPSDRPHPGQDVPTGPAGAAPDGTGPTPDGTAPTPDATGPTPDGTGPTPDGAGPTPDGAGPTPDGAGPTRDGTAPTPAATGATPGAARLPAPVDKLDVAAVALLTADPLAHRRVAEVGQTADLANLRAERDEALAKVDKLTAELERARAELVEERERARALVGEREAEYHQMRRRVSDQGARLRAALDARGEMEQEIARLRGGVDDELARARAETAAERERADRERRRADAAAGQVAAARQAAREARRGDEVRLELLLDTVSGAISGLRRELDVGAGGPRPADLVAGTGDQGTTGAHGAAPVDGLAALDALLTVPSVHLIVDGYNVSKTGYPDLPLADQRSRLVAQLGALGARTGAEITVVFDGAAVVAAPVRGSRGVRVLFSDAGVIADDVVRDLVAAEPAGRPLLVATSDQEIVRSVRRRGAHTVASAVLLRRLGG
ncbi:NYN domain-containing protein [Pseudonocardia sp. ICBG1293]|uniref:NYN domain-containing protein n=1 Tax=Pseudonocardia sp. ICBG1293 TaxID=2844382 RepID=UPI001CCE02DC|nr:NYN domain-containing protein [Pseudonocardia sp. ICBG1293]